MSYFGVDVRNAVAIGVGSIVPISKSPLFNPPSSLDLNFLTGTLDPRVTFTRSTTGTYFNSSGVLSTAAINAPRFDYNPSTLAPLGLLIEEARTNSIRNNTMQGAVAGTPGTLPTNWNTGGLGTLTQQIVGTGFENGITYIDVRFSGTTSTTSLGVRFEGSASIAATSGQVWTNSLYARLIAGSTTNVSTIGVNFQGLTSGGAITTDSSTTNFGASIAASNLAANRISTTRTLSDATTAFVRPQIIFGFTSGVTIDITLRIGLPQLEQGAFATSVIPTTSAAVQRTADVAIMTGTNFSSWYNASEGTLFTQSSTTTGGGAALRRIAWVDDTTSNNRITLRYSAAATDIAFTANVSGSTVVNLFTSASLTPTVSYKSAGAYIVDNYAFGNNGALIGTDTSAGVPVVNTMRIGSGINSEYLNGWIQRITYYPTRLANLQLQILTK